MSTLISIIDGTKNVTLAVEKFSIIKTLQAIKDAGMEDSTIVILSSDHGGIEKGHGGISMTEMQIPWIIAGPGIKQGHQINSSIMTFDTAATIAKIFDLEVPQVWIGRPVHEAFTSP